MSFVYSFFFLTDQVSLYFLIKTSFFVFCSYAFLLVDYVSYYSNGKINLILWVSIWIHFADTAFEDVAPPHFEKIG